MTRTPLAMRTLIRQVETQRSDVDFVTADLDGLNVYRTIAFDEKGTEWLEPLAEVLGSDPRIAGHEVVDNSLHITFVADIRADRAKPDFPLAEVDAILHDEPDEIEARRAELKAEAVADLRIDHGFGEDDRTPKAEIIEAILRSEFDPG